MCDRQASQEMTGMTGRGQAELQTMLKLVKTPQRRGAEFQTASDVPQTIQNSRKFSTNFAERRNMLKWEPASPLRNHGAFKPWVKTWRFQAFRGLYQCCKCQRIYSESTVTGKYDQNSIHWSADQVHTCMVQNLLDSEVGGATGL